MSENKELVKSGENKLTKFDEFNNIEEMLQLADHLIQSGLIPNSLNTPEKVVAIIQQGKELGFKAMTSLNNLHNIQGKVVLSIHAIAALLKQSNVRYTIIKDCEPIKDKDGKNVNYITTIEFLESWEGQIIKNQISYTLKEASKAGLATKENWQKMMPIMLRTRCLAIGARFVAPHALLGLYEAAEFADFKDISYEVNEEGEVTIEE